MQDDALENGQPVDDQARASDGDGPGSGVRDANAGVRDASDAASATEEVRGARAAVGDDGDVAGGPGLVPSVVLWKRRER